MVYGSGVSIFSDHRLITQGTPRTFGIDSNKIFVGFDCVELCLIGVLLAHPDNRNSKRACFELFDAQALDYA